MKSLKAVSKRDYQRIYDFLRAGMASDAIHEIMCNYHGLHHVKMHGKGKPYQKQKVEHLWRAILFTQYDTPEFSNKLTEDELTQIKNYLEL